MINHSNWKLSKEYLEYHREVDRVKEASIRIDESHLRHLLERSGETPLAQVTDVQPAFVEYLRMARNDGKDIPLSSEYIAKVVRTAKRFLGWLTLHRGFNDSITQIWLDKLRPPRITSVARGLQRR